MVQDLEGVRRAVGQRRIALSPDELGWVELGQPPELAPKGGDVPVLDLRGQTELLEGQDQIVRPQDQLQVDGVRPEAARGTLIVPPCLHLRESQNPSP